MKRFSAVLLTAALLVVMLVTPAAADPPEGGFVLTDTDAAYASFVRTNMPGDTYCELFVGYVWAGTLKYFDGDLIRPHSDLEVRFEDCGPWTGLSGVIPTVDEPAASIVKLTTADIDNVEVVLWSLGPYHLTGYVNLTWTATGDVVNEKFGDATFRANHRSRFADVTGAVTILYATEGGTGIYRFNADEHLVVAEAPEVWPKITHFNTVVFGT